MGTEITQAGSMAAAAGTLIEVGGGEAVSLGSRPVTDVIMPNVGSQAGQNGHVGAVVGNQGGEGRGSFGCGGGVAGSNRNRFGVADAGRGMKDLIISKTQRGPKHTAFKGR